MWPFDDIRDWLFQPATDATTDIVMSIVFFLGILIVGAILIIAGPKWTWKVFGLILIIFDLLIFGVIPI